ncbi:1-acyl-sn-glycerol-3-phosphate acyltransferase [Agitococcus lubricus]|uniref:Acyltransferase-like protein n=1 Tax=Agitococcus lubricus TaxID=1077255 RepID=A0A2T5IWX0_9GAMM|nr:1-acyl-sn-glycerol-3-phosphate acyltransferase [Agitococcus lubricus]PTQ88432.1 acyltransferase-like protein [Agitococcus lubricus]
MLAKFIAKGTFAFTGWTFKNQLPADIKQCVMIAAPHTSNWDALYTRTAFVLMGIPVKITIKDSYMRFPYGPFVRYLGGIGINRRPKKAGEERESMVQLMADLFKTHPDLVMLVTPEGTRSLRTKWKTGFYHIAVTAKVPIALGYLDYNKKEAGVGKVVYPSGNMHKDMHEIMAFYKHIAGKHPENFSVDLDYHD